MSGNILIIDDEIKLLKLLGMILSQENFNVKEASTARSAMTMLEQYDFDVVLSDVRLPDAFGVDLVNSIKTKYPHLEIILMTAFGNITDAVQAMKNGAYDYLVKGDDNEKIIPLVYKALDKVKDNKSRIIQPANTAKGFEQIIGKSPAILQAKKLAEKVALTDAAVLLTGETGTGRKFLPMPFMKEATVRRIALWRSIVPHSVRKFWRANFLAINRELLQEL